MMLKAVAISLMLFFFSTSCNKTDCIEGLNTTIFQVGVEYCINDNQVFTIVSMDDSRCPKNATCVWEGKTEIYIKSTKNGMNKDTVISFPNVNTTVGFDFLAGYSMMVDSVTPYPKLGTMILLSQYRVHAVILKK
ncbi:MAG: hypothetical protein IPM42_18130 [Saprospiraceae bacterium]|nr:hypothetical protein [Saprospiraceae bacterium]